MEYKVHFSLTIWSLERDRQVFGSKELSLPFVPFIGLRLEESYGSSPPVLSISWNDDKKYFHCFIEDQETEVEYEYGYDVNLEFLVEKAKEDGWSGFNKTYEINS